jgi:hypothetical protein
MVRSSLDVVATIRPEASNLRDYLGWCEKFDKNTALDLNTQPKLKADQEHLQISF